MYFKYRIGEHISVALKSHMKFAHKIWMVFFYSKTVIPFLLYYMFLATASTVADFTMLAPRSKRQTKQA